MNVDSAEDRRRIYLALRDNPDGITAPDFESEPTIDGGPRIPRVAPRIHELRAEHNIPIGPRRGAFALYRLSADAGASVSRLRDRTAHLATHRDGYEVVRFCGACRQTFPQGHKCPQGHPMQEWLSGTGATAQACRHINQQEVRDAA